MSTDQDCGQENPEVPGMLCNKTVHPYGVHMNRDTSVIWEGLPQPPRQRGAPSKDPKIRIRPIVQGIADSGATKATGPPSLALYRKNDPPTSKEAAERYEPKRETAKGRVLAYLRARLDQWVDAPELTAPEVGGFAGTRRLRELREMGWQIETRAKPGSTNTWQHRLVAD